MVRRATPPYPTSDLKQWALQLVEYLASRDESEGENLPETVQLSHQIPPGPYRALTDGMLMFDPSLGVPVYSGAGVWKQFTAQGDLNYLVTDDAGNGTVVDDINNTDFTGQTGAIGQCAQCPVQTNTSFYHKGVQYLYTGPTPASYGAGCPDTMDDLFLIPVGVGTFLALSDTPDDYTGFAGYWPRVSPGENALVFDQIEEADITDLDRVRWRGNWVQQQYLENDMVFDNPWTMIANKTTTDRAGPQPFGDPQWTLPDAPVWDTPYPSFNGVVRSGVEFDINEPIQYQAVQVWAPALDAAINYVLFVYAYTTGGDGSDLTVIQTPEPLLLEDEWTTVTLNSGLLTAGQTIGIFIDTLNSGGDTLVNGGWGRGANSNDTLVDPGSGSFGSNNANTLLRLNYIDLDAVDRTLELQGIIAGSTIQLAQTNDASRSFTFTINADGVDQTTHISFQDVTLADTGPNGEPLVGEPCSITITIPIPQPTDYVEQVGALTNPSWGIARGILSLNGEQQVGVDANAYGVRLLADNYVVSADWDIVSLVGSGGGSSSGTGGASKFTELGDTPSDYGGLAQQIMRVNLAETGLEARPQGVQAHSDQDTYAFDDIVSFEGALYHCIVPHSAQPFSLVNWSPASQPVGSGVTLSYNWSDLVTGDPGAGGFAITDPMANPTNTLRVNDLTTNNIDVSAFWDAINIGDFVAFVEDTGGAESGVWVATGPSVNQGTYHDIPVNWVANTGEPEDGRKGFAFIISNPDARLPPGGDDEQILAKASAADYDTEWVDPPKAGATVGDTFPVSPNSGDLHYKTGKHVGLYVWYVDPDSSQWVATNGGGINDPNFNPFLLKAVGEPFALIHDAPVPDNSGEAKFIILTKDLTDPGLYNEGLLRSQTESGSSPTHVVQATINVGPMEGVTINLWNSENRFPMAGTSAGNLNNDQMQNITGTFEGNGGTDSGIMVRGTSASDALKTTGAFTHNDSNPGNVADGSAGGRYVADFQFDASRVARTGNKTMPKNEVVHYYMRVV